jgi:anti-anti-sigma factor
MPDFKLDVIPPPVPATADIRLTGSITSTNVTLFAETLERFLVDGIRVILIGMKDIAHISSAALAELVSVADRLERLGGGVVLAEVQPKTRVIIDTLGLRRIFEMVATIEDGRNSLKERAAKLSRAPRLIALIDGKPGHEYPIVIPKVTIGSDLKCTIVLKHPQVEGTHAEVSASGDRCVVRDLGSRYGTFIDGARLKPEGALQPFGVLAIATFKFTFAKGR